MIDIDVTRDNHRGNETLVMNVNTEKGKCKKTGSNKETGESEFHEFGTPIENKKTLIK